MESWFDLVMLSRLQFAVTTMFHITWPLLPSASASFWW